MSQINIYYYLAQVVGLLGLGVSLFAFFQKDLKKFKLTFALSSVLWAGSYYLLKGYTSAAIIAIIAIRQFAGVFTDKFSNRNKVVICLTFIILSGIFTIYTWQGMISLLPFINNTIATIAYFFASPIELRKRLVLTDVLWAVNSILLHSYIHLFGSIVSIAINLFTINKIKRNERTILPAAEV